jgi:hypothetical protein
LRRQEYLSSIDTVISRLIFWATMKFLRIAALAFLPFVMTAPSFASSHGPYYGGGKHTASHGAKYPGGRGSSHKGGKYRSPSGQHVYGRHK